MLAELRMYENECAADDYVFRAENYEQLREEVNRMENSSRWLEEMETRDMSLEAVFPLDALRLSAERRLDYEAVMDTAQERTGTGMLLNLERGGSCGCVRSCALASLHRAAKLDGSAFSRMSRTAASECLNMGLHVAQGKSLVLVRDGKITAVLSQAKYCVMPISELLRISVRALEKCFGAPVFLGGENRHYYTSAVWSLPDVQTEMMKRYGEALDHAVSHCFTANFMPCVRFESSDTGHCRARLLPLFRMSSGAVFPVGDGVAVRHENRSGRPHALYRYREEAEEIFACFRRSMEQMEKLGKIEIWNADNAVVSLCNRYGIPKKYGDAAREQAEMLSMGGCISAHDVYLCLAEAVFQAGRQGAGTTVRLKLEEALSRILRADWSEHDVGGTVAWK